MNCASRIRELVLTRHSAWLLEPLPVSSCSWRPGPLAPRPRVPPRLRGMQDLPVRPGGTVPDTAILLGADCAFALLSTWPWLVRTRAHTRCNACAAAFARCASDVRALLRQRGVTFCMCQQASHTSRLSRFCCWFEGGGLSSRVPRFVLIGECDAPIVHSS